MTEGLIQDVLLILAGGTCAALVSRYLGAPILIGYLLVGVLLGDGVLGWVLNENHELEHVAETGVFLLLFTIGLEFSLEDFRSLRWAILGGGGAQMALVAAPVFGVFVALGYAPQAAALIAIAVSFSSTVLVFRGLNELGQSSGRAGQRAIGVLLFQDAALVPLLLVVPLLTAGEATVDGGDFLRLAIASCGFIAAVFLIRWILSRWLVPLLAGYRSPQLVVLITVTLLGALALIAYRLGLPPAVGAFAAGFVLNGNRWTEQIDALILPFRETFAAIFFVSLGLIFRPGLWVSEPLTLSLGLVLLLVLKACAGTLALRFTGLGWRPAVGMGVGLAHVGEFAFVVMLGAFSAGGIGEADYQRFVIIGVCSLILTPLLLEWGIGFAQSAAVGQSEEGQLGVWEGEQRHAIVIGAGPIGRRVASLLETMGRDVCVVDLSPVNLHPFAVAGMRTVAGDASQWATLRHAAIEQADLVVVVVPNDDQAIQIVDLVRRERPEAQVVVRCRYQVNQKRLLEAGCEVVVSEETVTAERIAAILDGRGE